MVEFEHLASHTLDSCSTSELSLLLSLFISLWFTHMASGKKLQLFSNRTVCLHMCYLNVLTTW